MSRRVAVIISRIFDPVWIIPAMLAAATVWSLVNGLRWRFLIVLILVDGFIPFLYFVHLLRSREITDWDTTNRIERFRLFGFTIVVHGVGVVLAMLFGKQILALLLLSFWVLAVAFFLVTLVWKISVHAGVFVAAVTFAAFAFDPRWWVASAFLLPIGWARVTMKKHSTIQVIAGAVLASSLLLAMFSLLGIHPEDARRPSQGIPWFLH